MTETKTYQLTTETDSSGCVIPMLVDPDGKTVTTGSTYTSSKNYKNDEDITIEISTAGELVTLESVSSGPTAWTQSGDSRSTTVTLDGRLRSAEVGFIVTASVEASGSVAVGKTTTDGWVCSGPSRQSGWNDWTLDPYVKLKRSRMLGSNG